MSRSKTMPEIREIIRRLRNKQSIREIRKETGVHRKTIRKVIKLATKHDWLNCLKQLPDDHQISLAWSKPASRKSHPLDIWQDDFKRWVEDGTSFLLMHDFIKDQHKCSESTVRRYVKRKHGKRPRAVMKRDTTPGKVMEVDFGELGLVYDPIECRNRKVYVFSGRLVHSRKTYRQICFDQKHETFFQCHINAFEHFGGVPETVRPDNLKAAVIKACWYEPLINRAYRSLAEHYDFVISPCKAYHPEHKGSVESDIKYIKGNFWPRYKETEFRKGRKIPHTTDISEALRKWDNEVADVRILKGIADSSPREIFESEEKSKLKSLPIFRWQPVRWVTCNVNESWRIRFDCSTYTVPHEYIGKKVQACIIANSVHIFHDFKEICSHERAKRKYQDMSKPYHAPDNCLEYLQCTYKGLLDKAACLGPNIHAVASKIFEDKYTDGKPAVHGLLGFVKKYSLKRVEAACHRALGFNTPTYKSVKNILLKGLDEISEKHEIEETQLHFRFAREYGFFNNK